MLVPRIGSLIKYIVHQKVKSHVLVSKVRCEYRAWTCQRPDSDEGGSDH